MNTSTFRKSISLTSARENYIASAVARKFSASLCFNTSSDLQKWDFVLYSIDNAWATSVEMQDDYFMQSEEDSLCIELLTHTDPSNPSITKAGKLNYTKAKRLSISSHLDEASSSIGYHCPEHHQDPVLLTFSKRGKHHSANLK
jgi:hypothetical protein